MTTSGWRVYAGIWDWAIAVKGGPWSLGFTIGANHVESRGDFSCRRALDWGRSAIFSANQAGYFGLGANVGIVLPSYLQVVEALTPTMRELPGVIVTIDGRDGVGKTTLGRYLAWQFNVTLIETDLFLIPAQDYLIYLDDQINRIIERRITLSLPVIVEGVSMLQLMHRINRVPAFSIYVTNQKQSSSEILDRRLFAYEAAFSPSAKASLVVKVEH